MKTVTKFIAEDGTEFGTSSDCIIYEHLCLIQKIKKKNATPLNPNNLLWATKALNADANLLIVLFTAYTESSESRLPNLTEDEILILARRTKETKVLVGALKNVCTVSAILSNGNLLLEDVIRTKSGKLTRFSTQCGIKEFCALEEYREIKK